MTDESPVIVFMGTPEFAVASLRALKENDFDVAAVVTVADKPSGRGQKLTMSAVKKYAVNSGIRVLQPEKLRDQSFINALKEINADIFVVVAFRMLPEDVWSLPRLGTFNLHASLLPQYRGAAPVNHAIINGEQKTGVTTFLIDREIDTGKILLSRETPIYPEENAGQLHDRLMMMGAGLVIETVNGLYRQTLKPVSQVVKSDTALHCAPRIFPADTVIDWNDSNIVIHNKIRGLSPYPGAVTAFVSKEKRLKVKIFEAHPYDGINCEPGTIKIIMKNQLIISCRQGSLEITSLQAEGRKRMSTSDFLRGTDLTGFHAI